MSNTSDTPTTPAAPTPAMQGLDRLVGDWTVSGGATGTVTYEWMAGGHFLLQHIDLQQDGMAVTGMEVIGHERPFGADGPGEDIRSRYYGGSGSTFDYVYELEGDTLTIWAGDTGSPAFFRGTFSSDGRVLDGAWTYPGGGGYASTMARLDA